jgi:hypothetical protein
MLVLLSAVLGMLLLVAAPDNEPMWASATLCVHVFYIHCGLVLDSMTQAIASHRIASRRFASRRIASRRIASCRVASRRVALRRIVQRAAW